MTKKEKTLFLFKQTCHLISQTDLEHSIKKLAEPNDEDTKNFNSLYQWLEMLLNEKLKNCS